MESKSEAGPAESESEAVPTESEASIDEDSDSSDSSNTSEYEDSKRKKRQKSDLPKKFNCNHCNRGFVNRNTAYKHSGKCKKRLESIKVIKCNWCNLEFKNRGNLATHAFHMHGDSSYKAIIKNELALKGTLHQCNVCKQTFGQGYLLRYHIRKMHFNLRAKRPYAELKRVNQVWFEKVINSNNILEIKKTGQNTLVMRKLDENTAIKVRDVDTEVIDLSDLYPCDQRRHRVRCELCGNMYYKRDISKHKQEVHMKITKHHCNNCNRSFKRSYQYIQHVCTKVRRIKGVRNNRQPDGIQISAVESLTMPWA